VDECKPLKSGAAVTDTAWRGLFEVGRRARARAVRGVERGLKRAERKLRLLLHRANDGDDSMYTELACKSVGP